MPRPYYKLLLEQNPGFLVNALSTVDVAIRAAEGLEKASKDFGINPEASKAYWDMIGDLTDLLVREIPDPEVPPIEPIDFLDDGLEHSTRKLAMLAGCKTPKDKRDLKRELAKLAKNGLAVQTRKGWWKKVGPDTVVPAHEDEAVQ